MCTGFVKKGKDLVIGYNLDLGIGVWDYRVYARADAFYIGIKAGSTLYRTHGVNKNGSFACLPYMNDPEKGAYRRGKAYQRIDLLVDRFLSGKLTYPELLTLVSEKELVSAPNTSMHALFAGLEGKILLAEPGLGYREIVEDYAVISNFPLLETVEDLSPAWYGKNRYDTAVSLLAASGEDFSAQDGLRLLAQTRQGGEWATRVSFVYSQNAHTVFYATEDDFSDVKMHAFGK